MAPKKKARNNKAKKSQEDTPRPPTTVPCEKCGEEITVPKTCKHGKKLINCQGTGCTTAHLEEHKDHCNPPLQPPKAPNANAKSQRAKAKQGSGSVTPSVLEQMVAVEAEYVRQLARQQDIVANVAKLSQEKMNKARLTAMGDLVVALNAVLKLRGGKRTRYVKGIPFDEWMFKLEQGPLSDIAGWEKKLIEVALGNKTIEQIGYDDEESADEGTACPTPEADD